MNINLIREKKTTIVDNLKSFIAYFSGAIGFGLVINFIMFQSEKFYHSDCTDTIMWAETMFDAGKIMNPDFGYACLLPFGGNLILAPFIKIYGMGMQAQLAGMTAFAIIYMLAIVFLFKSLDLNARWASIGVGTIMIVLSSSEKLREIFWCHIIYYSLGLVFLMIGLGLAVRCIKSKKIDYLMNFLLFVWTLLAATNGVQALATYILPVLGAVVAEMFFDTKTNIFSFANTKKYIVIAVLLVSTFIGLKVGAMINGDIVAGYEDGYSSFSDYNTWFANFQSLFVQLVRLFNIIPEERTKISSIAGIVILLKLIVMLLIVIIPFVMAFMYKKFESFGYRIMILTHFMVTAVIMLGWVFGSLSAACWRLSPVIGTSVILCVMFACYLFRQKKNIRFSAIVIIPLLIFLVIICKEMKDLEKEEDKNAELKQVIQYLEEAKIENGYGTFWNANIVTLLSDSKVKARCIGDELFEGITPRYYQGNSKWYTEEHDRYFVILTGQEISDYCDSQYYIEPENMVNIGQYYIMIYSFNPV